MVTLLHYIEKVKCFVVKRGSPIYLGISKFIYLSKSLSLLKKENEPSSLIKKYIKRFSVV